MRSNTPERFDTKLTETIAELQERDLDVEVQYVPIYSSANTGGMRYSALVIGRR